MAKTGGSALRSESAAERKAERARSRAGMHEAGIDGRARVWTWWRRGEVSGMEEKKERLEEKGASGEESGATAAGEGVVVVGGCAAGEASPWRERVWVARRAMEV